MMAFLILLFSTFTFAGTSRVPAVLDSSCDLSTAEISKPLIEIHREQCIRVHQCMNSAADEEMPALKKLEALVCKGELVPVTTSVPKIEVNKAELDNNSRNSKQLSKESPSTTNNSSTKEK